MWLSWVIALQLRKIAAAATAVLSLRSPVLLSDGTPAAHYAVAEHQVGCNRLHRGSLSQRHGPRARVSFLFFVFLSVDVDLYGCVVGVDVIIVSVRRIV